MTGEGYHRLRCDDFRQSMAFYLRIVAITPEREDEANWIVEGEFEALKEEAAAAAVKGV